jgi:DNA-directed RNA polymerase specialized sigma24 family protein
MRIHSQIDTLKDCGKNQGWIYQITRDAIIDYYRAQKKTEELPPTLAGPEPKLSDKAKEDISTCLMPMIENLPAVSRTFTAVRRDRHSYRVQGEIGTRCISELTLPRPPVQAISSNRHTNGQQGT